MRSQAEAPTETVASEAASNGRNRRTGRVRRILLWSVLGLVGVLVLALAVTAALDVWDARRFAAPGDLVELPDGRVLHLQVAGEGQDGPTVVLDAGHGGFSPLFAWVQQELAATHTVVAYDRPGYGWSDPADREVDAAATVDDLHAALAARGLPGPYVLAGHSLGGLYVRVFADRYPDDVAGLVLLDPAHEDQVDHLPEAAVEQLEEMQGVANAAAWLARFGLFRRYNPQDVVVADLPEAAATQVSALSASHRYWRAAADEGAAVEAIGAVVPRHLGDHPVRIINAPVAEPDDPGTREVMDALQRELAASSPRAELIEIPGATHLTLLIEREHAQAVARVITDLLEELGAEVEGRLDGS